MLSNLFRVREINDSRTLDIAGKLEFACRRVHFGIDTVSVTRSSYLTILHSLRFKVESFSSTRCRYKSIELSVPSHLASSHVYISDVMTRPSGPTVAGSGEGDDMAASRKEGAGG